LRAWNEKHWIKPELIEQTELMQVKLVLHILNEGDTQSVPQSGTQSGTQDDTQGDTQGDTQDDTQGLDLDSWIENEIANNPKITTEELAQKSKKGIRTIKRHLAKLKHINYVGSGYSGHWEIIQK
jgi:ATP-dependent DNA helicase RecG